MVVTEKTLDDIDIHSIDRYLEFGYPWEAWDRLRDEAPIYRYERPGIQPFWALTRYADVRAVGSDNARFINGGPILRLAGDEHNRLLEASRQKKADRHGWDPNEVDDMVYLDQPRHTAFRMLVARQFTPARCRRMGDELASLAERFVREFQEALGAADGAPIDLVDELAVKLPLATICSMMGVSVDRWSDIHRWTDSLFNTDSMAWAVPGETRQDMRRRLRIQYFTFLEDLIADKRANPGDDLTSLLVHATVDGQPLTQQQLHGYLSLLISAGNETTRNATTRGILALLEHPEQLAVLEARADDATVETTVEEVVRWTSPVIQFARTATEDVEIHGATVKAGEIVGLWYPSANRDERAFVEPYRFDVLRNPNDHVGFGHGPHFCLGANLARWELRAVFKELARRRVLSTLEPAGPAEWMTDLHVGAIAHQAVRRV
ncbi:MAG: cytochrome P450 [Acidimicrobiales bacterium]|nr:cytochrome P450 [Acidimicrobiales bacterium]